MKKRWLPITLLVMTIGPVATTIKLTYNSLVVWYAGEHIILPYLDRVRDGVPPVDHGDFERVIEQLTSLGKPGVEAILQRLPQERVSYPVGPCTLLLIEVARNDPDSMRLLLEKIDSDSESVRFATALTLGYYDEGRQRAVPYLQALTRDSSSHVRDAATFAIAMIRPELVKEMTVNTAGTSATNDDTDMETEALILSGGWDADDPMPTEKTNCVRCHLTAGRELTAPVHDFARSVHDRARMSCNDCHGGNTDDDTTAHGHEFGFIGTKLSAHMAACADCHTEEAEAFRKGPHYWDLTKRINRDYPVCIDCHGNHDVGKPPTDFSLTNVCSDCHKNLDTAYPGAASIVAENDRLWQTLRKVHAKTGGAVDPTPVRFRSEVGRIRRTTARLVHSAAAVPKDQADTLNGRVQRLREELETWLKQNE